MGFGVLKGYWVESAASDWGKKATSASLHVCLGEDAAMVKVEGGTKRSSQGNTV